MDVAMSKYHIKDVVRKLFDAYQTTQQFEESFRSIGIDLQETEIYTIMSHIQNAMLELNPGEYEKDTWLDDLSKIRDFDQFWDKYFEVEFR